MRPCRPVTSGPESTAVPNEAVDVFNHCLPPRYVALCRKQAKALPTMFERALEIPGMTDLEERVRIVDGFDGYRQILSLASPAIESIATTSESAEALARAANDEMSTWAQAHPNQFAGFIASLPMNSPHGALAEARRAVEELGALGVQVYTHINGQPLDGSPGLEILELMASLGRPVWLHPLRPSTIADYPDEKVSKYDLWWAFGWPHETSVCAGRLVFAGVFDRWPTLKIITHHAGGTLPMMRGRIEQGLQLLGTRYAPEHAHAAETSLQEEPLHAFQRFYADTATFGSQEAIMCAASFFGETQLLFASDFPFADIKSSIQAAQAFGFDQLHQNYREVFHEHTEGPPLSR